MDISLTECPLNDHASYNNSTSFSRNQEYQPDSVPSTIDKPSILDFPGIAVVQAGRRANRRAVSELFPSRGSCKFIFVVNNMTGFSLTRTDSVGGDSWPFSTVKKGECVAALYNQSTISSLAVEFTAIDSKPGILTVVLYASWPTIGSRKIGVYAGEKATTYSRSKIQFKKVHDHQWHGNKATICNHENCYVFEYDLKELDFVQFGLPAVANIRITKTATCIESFRAHKGKLPGFVFVVNNLTGFDLTVEDDLVNLQGTWPLGDIKKGECAVAGFDGLNMSLAAHYTARKAEPYQKSISLAGSWPAMGFRKICFSTGRAAKYAWKNLSSMAYEDNGNSAKIIEIKDENVCVYYYELTNL